MDRGEKFKWREREREFEFEFALGQKIYLKKLKFRSWRVEFHDLNV